MMYEVETRVHFENMEEAFTLLPFLRECLTKETRWETRMFDGELFESGRILRVSKSKGDNPKGYLGYKEPDLGIFYNIRKEIDEDITNGTKDSIIMNLINGTKDELNLNNINQTLESLGHRQFLLLEGTNLTGYYEKFHIDLKLMLCSMLKYPILLEIEKTAETIEESLILELELKKFIEEYKLEDRVLKNEPPSLLK